MQTAIHVSRFRDSLTPGALPLVEEFDGEFRAPPPSPVAVVVVSIHHHAIQSGRCLVFEWAFDPALGDYRQIAVTNVASVDNARAYVPGGFERLIVPSEFGIEAWRAV